MESRIHVNYSLYNLLFIIVYNFKKLYSDYFTSTVDSINLSYNLFVKITLVFTVCLIMTKQSDL